MVVKSGLREISYENKEQLSAVLARGQSLNQPLRLSGPARPSRATESCDVVFKKFLVGLVPSLPRDCFFFFKKKEGKKSISETDAILYRLQSGSSIMYLF